MTRDWQKQLSVSNTKVYLIRTGVALLFATGIYFLWRRISYAHPGPAVLMFGFAAVISLLAWYSKEQDRATPHLPRVIGIEKLVRHWVSFKVAESNRSETTGSLDAEESRRLYEQIYTAQCMYPGSPQLIFERCFPGRQPAKSVLVVRPSGQVLQVLKFDRVGNIRKEMTAYDDCIAHKLSDHSPGKPRPSVPLTLNASEDSFGAIAYEFAQKSADSSVKTFAEYYLDADELAVGQALKKIKGIMEGWYNNTRRGGLPGSVSQYDEYRRLRVNFEKMVGKPDAGGFWGVLQPSFRTNLADCDPVRQHFQLTMETGSSIKLVNPLYWVHAMFGDRGKQLHAATWSKLDQNVSEKVSAVHGDFHAGNILVEEVGGKILIWLIDFAKTHVGPTVQDIARLETDVKFALLPSASLEQRGIGGLCKFEDDLLPGAYTDDRRMASFVPEKNTEEGGDFGKARNAVRQLRRAAQDQMSNDARVYQLALLHATLPILYYQDRTPWQKLYAFISAALLCQRLGVPEELKPRAVDSVATPDPGRSAP